MQSAPDELTEEGRAWLQRRVSLFGEVMFLIAFVAVVLQFLITPHAELLAPWFGGLLFYTLIAGAAWLGCRRGAYSARFLRTVEAIVLVGGGETLAVTGWLKQPVLLRQVVGPDATPEHPFYGYLIGLVQNHMATSLIFAVALGAVVRAALVPSRPLRTVVLTILAGTPTLALMSGALPLEPEEAMRELMPARYGFLATVNAAIWLFFTTAVAAVLSHVIYGLRRQVREAQQLGQYTLERRLGAGGMGEVYRARHAMMRRPTAIKLLSPEKTGEANLIRFEREVQLTAKLTHPNTITIFDYGRTPDGVFYYAMELLDGATLEEIVAIDGAQPSARVAAVLTQVAGALEEAHGIGLIHRDIKPANIILCERGGMPDVAKLVDFGLVKEIEAPAEIAVSAVNVLTGTPLYMAPEQITAPDRVDARTDLYALGAVGYFLLTGTHVFGGGTLVEVCSHHLHTEPVPPSERLGEAVGRELEEIVLACLAKRPADRPDSAHELWARLSACRCAEAWDTEHARAWWTKHGEEVRARHAPGDRSTAARTLALDLTRRAAGSEPSAPDARS